MKNWKKIICGWAKELAIAERIDYFDGGNLDGIIQGSQGVVTVNSTVGIRAVQLGSPVITLGDAIYDVDGLAFQGGIDQFWTAAPKPSSELVDAFIAAICHSIQIRGTFYSEPGLTVAVDTAVNRLFNRSVGID
jgi:capsular polysaccharide export protein